MHRSSRNLISLAMAMLLTNAACRPNDAGTTSVKEVAPTSSNPALDVVNAYYAAFLAGDEAAVKAALSAVFDKDVTLDSPLVIEKFKKPAAGAEQTLAFAMAAAGLLKHATVRERYVSTSDPWTIATIIDEPNPCGNTPQSEYFKIDPQTHKIKSIYSNYDPRLLLAFLSGAGCPKS
jgi:hypothetical protein